MPKNKRETLKRIRAISKNWQPEVEYNQDHPTNIPCGPVKEILSDIFSNFASNRIVKKGSFRSDTSYTETVDGKNEDSHTLLSFLVRENFE